ncbi:SGNH/GDSL hydrolase family protein [Flavobacterium noncentrifugens]|uniref:Lysophospholipase L1 n=1 Tax=Flavobacterium noncentrifugens TaxID=1128970 RepID=A0A1G8YSY4_9FLAO|nr:SGNH/GDSL hydrolase family protein [Flavobacterium noncentrifugens]SDK05195.1 Lysophospholipase L1 [Flavobacterium noncentrifugens]
MKIKIALTAFLLIMAKNATAQDWANLNRFKNENTELAAKGVVKKGVVFMGNSITEGWLKADPDFFRSNAYVNRGIGGQTTPQMLLRFRADVINLKPTAVVILAGTNDIAGNTGPSTLEMITDNIASMAELAQANGIKVILCAVLPAFNYPWKPGLEPAQKIVSLNEMIKSYAKQHRLQYIDYHSAMKDERNGLKKELSEDGVHPNKTGYGIMKPLAEKAIAATLKQ